MTYPELIEATGFNRQSLIRYLSGEREMTVGRFVVIARALGLDPADVLRDFV